MEAAKYYLDDLFDDPCMTDKIKKEIAWVIARGRGIKRTTFRDRLKREWALYDACMEPARKTNGRGGEE